MKPLGISNLRIYATVTNLFCIKGYSGIDPDVNTDFNAGGNGFPTPNYDYQAYPKTRSWTFGLNLATNLLKLNIDMKNRYLYSFMCGRPPLSGATSHGNDCSGTSSIHC